jgi:AcrR family transcriptional regulator
MQTDTPAAGASRTLTEQGREKKQLLLDVAADLFARHGYASTRVMDICRAAGAAKGLFYWYFPTKEALFAELVATVRLRLRKAQRDAFDTSADALTQIAQGTEASLRFMAEHAAYFAVLETESTNPGLRPVALSGADVHLQDLLRLITLGQEQGVIRNDDDAELLALAVIGTVAQFSNTHRRRMHQLSIDDVAGFVRRWVVRSLSPHPI